MRKAEKLSMLVDTIGSLILIFLFLVLLLLCFGIMVNALFDLKRTNKMVATTLQQAVTDLRDSKTPSKEPSTDSSKLSKKEYIEKLGYRGRSTLDSSTISFLFQIFAIALVSSGVYMLSRYHRNLVAVEQNARKILEGSDALKEYLEDGVSCSTISGLLLAGFGVSCALESASKTGVETMSCIASIRESIKQVLNSIITAAGSKRSMDAPQRDVLIDQLVAIKTTLKKAGGVDDVEKMCNDCIRELKEGGFVDRHRERKEKLESVWE